jgi:DNA-binding response OmpR family regulator
MPKRQLRVRGRPMRRRILAIEPDPDIATLYRVLFEQAGYAVQWAGDLLAVRVALLDLLPPRAPDLVLVDPWLPDGDGLTLGRELRARWPRVPIIALSTSAAARAWLLADCADAFFLKPFDPDELLAAVERMVTPSYAIRDLAGTV